MSLEKEKGRPFIILIQVLLKCLLTDHNQSKKVPNGSYSSSRHGSENDKIKPNNYLNKFIVLFANINNENDILGSQFRALLHH